MKTLVCHQQGVFMIEALIGILVFSLGVLAMVALGTVAVTAQTDAQYRTEASALANQVVSDIWLKLDRTTSATLQTSLADFQHQPTPALVPGTAVLCNFSGAVSTDPIILAWVTKVKGSLPGALDSGVQIAVDTTAGSFNKVSVTVCWQSPADKAPRHHSLVTYVN